MIDQQGKRVNTLVNAMALSGAVLLTTTTTSQMELELLTFVQILLGIFAANLLVIMSMKRDESSVVALLGFIAIHVVSNLIFVNSSDAATEAIFVAMIVFANLMNILVVTSASGMKMFANSDK